MRLLLIGYGRMGKLVDQLSESYGCEVMGRLDIDTNAGGAGITTERVQDVDVAIDFSTADAVIDNLPRLADLGVNLVVGTTGWQANEDAMRQIAAAASITVGMAVWYILGRRGHPRAARVSAESQARLPAPITSFYSWSTDNVGTASILIAATPNPMFDYAGIIVGAGRVEVRRFFAGTFFGKLT